MNTFQNNQISEQVPTFRAHVQLEHFRMPVQILHGDGLKHETIQPCQFAGEFSNSAFCDIANGPVMNLDDLDNSVNFYDSDPEILLSDSDEEEEGIMDDCNQSDAETTIGSDCEGELSDCCDCGDDVFDEPMNNTIPEQCSNEHSQGKSSLALTIPRRVFLEDCDTAKKQ